MTPAEWAQITELPKSIGKLKSVKHLILYGSSLVRIPPEIGEMDALEKFTPYTRIAFIGSRTRLLVAGS